MQLAIVQKGYSEDITVQLGYIECGEFVMEECNHAGATEQPTIGYSWWADAGIYVPDDDGPPVLVCDKQNCKAVYIEGEGWRHE